VTRNIIIHGLIVGTSLAAFIWIIQIDPYLSMNHSYDNFINFFVYPLALVVCGFFASIYLMTNLGDVWTYRFIFLAILSYSIGQLLFSQVFLWQQTVSHAVITSNRLIFWSDAADTVALLLRTFC
jgi:hypothetical protein